MSSFSPTEQQQTAIDCDFNSVITACPGSGKTTVIKEKIRSITSQLDSHQGVIAITFTKKASEELRKRSKENAHDTKKSFFGTIDSFCLNELILPFLARVWKGSPSGCRIVKSLDVNLTSYFAQNYDAPTLAELSSDTGFKNLYDNGILWMSSFAALSLLILQNSVAAQRYIRARYSHVFIDEYQDSSESQHELFIKLLELGLIATAVGDINQSIYRFRGSEPRFLIGLTENVANFSHFKLDFNHRCHPSIVNYASRVLNPHFQLIPCGDDIRVIRCLVNGSLEQAADKISAQITSWLNNGDIEHASNVAILGKKEVSLREISSNLNIEHRLHTNSPLIDIGTENAEIFSDFLLYRFKAITTAQEFIEKYGAQLKAQNTAELRRLLKAIRSENNVESFIEKCNYFIGLMGGHDVEVENDTVRDLWEDQNILKLFKPVAENEVQLMTLHKSKGLEFKIVFHIDLEEWTFPHRIPGIDWDDVVYSSLEEDTNLHYVGITRAEQFCILIRTSQRRNASGKYKKSRPSYFLELSQLKGLYR